MQTLRFLTLTTAALFAGALAACGSGGSSSGTTTTASSATAAPATDLKSTIQAAYDAHPMALGVDRYNGCTGPVAQMEYAYSGVPGAHFTRKTATCLTVTWKGSGITPDANSNGVGSNLVIGRYVVDSVGEPTVFQGPIYSIPVTVHFVYNDAGKILRAKDARAGNFALASFTPDTTGSVEGVKGTDGIWIITLPDQHL